MSAASVASSLGRAAARSSQRALGASPAVLALRVPQPCPSSSLPSSSRTAPARAFASSALRKRAAPVEQHQQQQQQQSRASDTQMHGVPQASLDPQARKISVVWSSGIESRYHNIWLRDHCRCPACYHPQTKQRQLDTFSISPQVKPIAVESTTEGLIVHWPRPGGEGANGEGSSSSSSAQIARDASADDAAAPHSSLYPWSWLHANSYAPSLSLTSGSGEPGSDMDQAGRLLWGKGIAQQPPTVNWAEVMDDDRGLLRWLSKIEQFGFCFVTGVPPTPEDTEALVRRIAFIRETHYGGFWDFTSDLSHGDTAYTNLALGAHTDTTYFTDPAGLQLFHLLSHVPSKDGTAPSGGESLLVDGFFAAKILKDVHPEAYEVLSQARFRTHSAGDDEVLIQPLNSGGYPILEHDDVTGKLVRVRYNNDDRSVLKLPEEQVLPFYDALAKWHEIITHVDSEYWEQLKPGNALIFDNHRVLHGRSAFVGNRRLCGAYVNHDDYRSRLAVLRKRYPDVASHRRFSRSSAEADDASQSSRGVWEDGL